MVLILVLRANSGTSPNSPGRNIPPSVVVRTPSLHLRQQGGQERFPTQTTLESQLSGVFESELRSGAAAVEANFGFKIAAF
jgi:hypothetical protein